jgi:hypothetical protein
MSLSAGDALAGGGVVVGGGAGFRVPALQGRGENFREWERLFPAFVQSRGVSWRSLQMSCESFLLMRTTVDDSEAREMERLAEKVRAMHGAVRPSSASAPPAATVEEKEKVAAKAAVAAAASAAAARSLRGKAHVAEGDDVVLDGDDRAKAGAGVEVREEMLAECRKHVKAQRELYAWLCLALPQLLRQEVTVSVEEGYGWGLWLAVCARLRVSLTGNKAGMIEQYNALKQDSTEDFAAYYARVESARQELVKCDVKLGTDKQMFAFLVVERLLPVYGTMVTVLRETKREELDSGGVDWVVVLRKFQEFEMSQRRETAGTTPSGLDPTGDLPRKGAVFAVVPQGGHGEEGKIRDWAKSRCYCCQELGHGYLRCDCGRPDCYAVAGPPWRRRPGGDQGKDAPGGAGEQVSALWTRVNAENAMERCL